jgi:predicted DNA-binding transcriptional regulator YafY
MSQAAKSLKYTTFLKLCRVLKAMAGPCGIGKERLMGPDYLDCRESALYDWLKLLEETFPGALETRRQAVGVSYHIPPGRLGSISVPRQLEWDEQVVLAYLLQHRPQFLPAGFDQAAQRLEGWLGSGVPRLEELFYVSPKGAPDSAILKDASREVFFEDLFSAMEGSTLIAFDYTNRQGRARRHTGGPLHLVQKDGKLHLLVWYPERREIRSHRPEQMTALECLDEPFEQPAGFVVADYVEAAWGCYFNDPLSFAVRIAPEAAGAVAGSYFTRQQSIEPQPDGSLIFRATTSGRREVINWILSFGPRARVLEPAGLADEVRAEYRRALALYPAD